MQPLLEPWFVTIGAKVGPKVVPSGSKCFIFLRELVKIAVVSIWSSMKILYELMYTSEEPSFLFLFLEQFSTSRNLDCTLCLLVLRTTMSSHNAISIVLLMWFLYSCRVFQVEIALGSTTPTLALPCLASTDSILDYGQYVILSMGNFLCSAPTVNSTMDFSIKPIEEGVVDSPLNSKLRLPILRSPSPLRSMDRRASSMSPGSSEKGTQRKLYGEESIPIETATRMPTTNQNALLLPTTAPTVAPTRRRVLSSLQGRYKRSKVSGSFSTVA